MCAWRSIVPAIFEVVVVKKRVLAVAGAALLTIIRARGVCSFMII